MRVSFKIKMDIKIKTNKNKYIYGNIAKGKNSKTLVVFMSGFSGSADFNLFKKASESFLRKGFDSLRFDFFSKHTKAFKPQDMSFDLYVSELRNIVDHLKKDYSKTVLIGHSFGTIISILFLNKYRKYSKNTGLIFWEPTLLPWKEKYMKEDFVFDKDKKLYMSKNSDEIMNEKFYQECIKTKGTDTIFGALNTSTLIIAARDSADKDAKKYFSKIKDKQNSKLYILDNTNHFFDGIETQKELFKKTISYLGANK